MTNPVDPGTLSALTTQIPLDAGIIAVSENRVTHFNETVNMVNQLNVVLPNAQTNAIAAKEGATDAAAARNAAQSASAAAVTARNEAVAAKTAAEAAAESVGNPVPKSDKATAAQITAGTADKWVDAAGLKSGLDLKINISEKATAADVTNGTANKWVDAQRLKAGLDSKQAAGSYAPASHSHTIAQVTGLQAALDGKQATGDYATKTGTETLTNKTLTAAKETQTDLGTANTINPRTISNAVVRPTGAISFSVGATNSNVDVGKSAVIAITPSAAVTFNSNSAVKWPGAGTPPSLLSGRTYILSLVNMQIGTAYFWFANIAGPY